jgi:hypothetical protein
MSHATKEQRQTIDHLIALVESGLAAPQEILNLALFQLEPEHDGSRAIQLLKTLPHEQRMRMFGLPLPTFTRSWTRLRSVTPLQFAPRYGRCRLTPMSKRLL